MKNSFIRDLKKYAKENRDRNHELAFKDTQGYWKYRIVDSVMGTIIFSVTILLFIVVEILMTILALNGFVTI